MSITINSTWHGGSPTMKVTGWFDYSVSGTTISVWGNVTNNRVYSSGKYGYNVNGYIVIGGQRTGDFQVTSGSYYGSTDFSGSVNTGSGNKGIEIHITCGQTGGCTRGYPDVVVGSTTVYVPDPYTPSSIWLNPNDYTKIGRVDNSNWSVHYSYNAGSNSDVAITLAIHDYDRTSWGVRWEPVLRRVNGSSDGVWDSVRLSANQGFTNGNRYRITLVSKGGEALSPASWNPQDGLVIYTYTEPWIGGASCDRSSLNANQDNTFRVTNINNRSWSSYENDFQTGYKIKRGNNDWSSDYAYVGNISSWYTNASTIRSLVPKNYDGNEITMRFRRYSPSAGWLSNNYYDVKFYVYYRPRIQITSSNVFYRLNNSSGKSLGKGDTIANNDSVSGIYVSWNYDTNNAQAGYVQGYRIRLYNKNNTVVKTYYTDSKNYTIPKSDIPKMQDNYIDITPYYKNDSTNTSSYWYYNGDILKFDFIHIVSNLNIPEIKYPNNYGYWINKDFRVCFTMPVDPDKGSEDSTYKYDNIEIEIANSIILTLAKTDGSSSNCIVLPSAFSSTRDNLTYQRNIVIYPNIDGRLNSLPWDKTYIRIRVKKKYNTTSDNNYGWSNWSNSIYITLWNPNYNPTKGDIIKSDDYNRMRWIVNFISVTYGINPDIPSSVEKGITIISQSQFEYKRLMKNLYDIKQNVNNYTTFDNNVKIDINNLLPTNFNTSQEHVTALSESDNGRNYIQIAYDRCRLLK